MNGDEVQSGGFEDGWCERGWASWGLDELRKGEKRKSGATRQFFEVGSQRAAEEEEESKLTFQSLGFLSITEMCLFLSSTSSGSKSISSFR